MSVTHFPIFSHIKLFVNFFLNHRLFEWGQFESLKHAKAARAADEFAHLVLFLYRKRTVKRKNNPSASLLCILLSGVSNCWDLWHATEKHQNVPTLAWRILECDNKAYSGNLFVQWFPMSVVRPKAKQLLWQIRMWINSIQPTPSAGKCTSPTRDLFWFCFSLAEKVSAIS